MEPGKKSEVEKVVYLQDKQGEQRGGGRKSPKEPAPVSLSSYSGSVSGPGQLKIHHV